MVINMQPHERTTIFSAFSGAKIKAGRAHKGPLQLFFTHPIPEDTSDLKHTAEKYFEFLDALEIPRSTHNGYEVFIDEKSAAQAEKLWHQAGLDDQTVAVGIHVGSIWATKRWTMVGFIELAKLMCNNGLTPVFFGGPQDVEAVAAIVQAIPCKTAVFTGKTTLLEFTYLAGKCRAFVSNDSGPAHLAASRETPVAMIFGPTLPQRYAPIYSRHIVLQSNEPCLGCGKKVCTDHRCMKNLSAEKVFEAVLDLIKPFSNNVP